MKVELTEGENLIRVLTVDLPPETVNGEMEKAFSDIRRKITLKGFRKGKAPMDIIKREYADQVRADVAEQLIKESYFDAVKEKTLNVASPPSVTAADYSEEGGFSYTAEVEVMPEVGKVFFDGLKLESQGTEASDDEVDEYVEYLRKQKAVLHTLDRAATADDVVILDLKKLHDPKMVLKTDTFSDIEVDLKGAMTVTEFKEQLVGLSAGDEKEIQVKYPDDYPDAAFAGAEIKYGCKVKSVKEKTLPEFNDAFAKSIGKGETALELKLALRKEIEQQKSDAGKRNLKDQVIGQICEKNKIPIPESMISHYLDQVIADFKKQDEKVDEEAVRTRYRPIGETTLRWNILLEKIAEAEKIEVSPEDTENLIKRFAENYQTTPEKAKEALTQSGRIREIRDSLLEDKVLDFLIAGAKIKKAAKK